jgi:hypothetical protein
MGLLRTSIVNLYFEELVYSFAVHDGEVNHATQVCLCLVVKR